jgi:hypothetical protein
MAGDPNVQSVIDARLAGRSRTVFTADEITAALHENGVSTSQEDVAAALDALVEDGKLKRRRRRVYWRFADEPEGPIRLFVYRAESSHRRAGGA